MQRIFPSACVGSIHGIWAAVDAGLGITLRTATGIPKPLRVMESKSGLPRLPMVEVSLHDSGRELTPAATRFREILFETIAENLQSKRKAKAVGVR
jgi:DNA-binding transcriptional LysR family regulator